MLNPAVRPCKALGESKRAETDERANRSTVWPRNSCQHVLEGRIPNPIHWTRGVFLRIGMPLPRRDTLSSHFVRHDRRHQVWPTGRRPAGRIRLPKRHHIEQFHRLHDFPRQVVVGQFPVDRDSFRGVRVPGWLLQSRGCSLADNFPWAYRLSGLRALGNAELVLDFAILHGPPKCREAGFATYTLLHPNKLDSL